MATCVRYLEHVFDKIHQTICKFSQFYLSSGRLRRFVFQGGKKLERARDLFEQCLESCPKEYSKSMLTDYSKIIILFMYDNFSDIYLLYAKLEEEHGLARHAMSIYSRATEAVPKDDVYDVSSCFLSCAPVCW